MNFRDRAHAGQLLARQLTAWRGRPDALVLALPRGGVPVAREVALALDLPLDVFVVRKLGAPGHEEYAVGAIASGGVRCMNDAEPGLTLSARELEAVIAREQVELTRREQAYRGARPPLVLAGRSVLLIDDGLATGATMRAAVQGVRQLQAARVVVAVPVASREARALLAAQADEVVCVHTPEHFRAVGLWYDDFEQTSDEEVLAALQP